MSDEKKPGVVITWETLLDISRQAGEREAESGQSVTVCCGGLAWMGIKKIFEDRLRGPFIGDVALIDTIRWIRSECVAAPNVMIVDTDQVEQIIPLVLAPTPNDQVTVD